MQSMAHLVEERERIVKGEEAGLALVTSCCC